MTTTIEIFVYGTLMQGQICEVSHIMKKAHFIGSASVCGVLQDCGGYPGLVLMETGGFVSGEVFQLATDQDLLTLDVYEECSANCPKPHPYRREKIVVTMTDGAKKRQVWAYLHNLNRLNNQQ